MRQDYDVVIIGSGAAGGMAAYVLCKAGVKCLMLEAGPMADMRRHRTMKAVYELPYRGFNKPGRFPHITQASEFDANVWIDEKANPYSYPENDPYYWEVWPCGTSWRAPSPDGRSNHSRWMSRLPHPIPGMLNPCGGRDC